MPDERNPPPDSSPGAPLHPAHPAPPENPFLQPPELVRQPAIGPEDMDMFDLAMLFHWPAYAARMVPAQASLVPASPVPPGVLLPDLIPMEFLILPPQRMPSQDERQPAGNLPAFERWMCDALCAEGSAFALEEAPQQQEEATLIGIPSPVPYPGH